MAADAARRSPRSSARRAIPAAIARGKTIYEINCRACHGVDLRGGDIGGPNLLRSQVALNDQEGELIGPVILQGRQNPGMPIMPPLKLSPDDVKAVAVYIHSVAATMRGQGSPPAGEEVKLNILVGDAAAGQAYFNKNCTSCHSISGDLQGIGSTVADPVQLQNLWVGGGGGGRGGGRGAVPGEPNRRQVTVVVTQPNGQKIEGRLDRIDDFFVVLTPAGGIQRTFSRNGDVPKVEVRDPLEGHRKLLGGVHGPGHPQRDGLPGDAEMTLKTARSSAPSIVLTPDAPRRAGADAASSRQSIRKPLSDAWPTYSGDYSSRRYSALTQVTQTTVKNLSLAWIARLSPGAATPGGAGGGRGFGGGGFGGGGGAPTIVGGEGTGDFPIGGGVTVKGAILQVNGILYVTAPDNVWAMDARDGRVLWQYFWKTKGGTHIGNRGAAIWNNYLFFETPDNYLVSLDARTGKERWHVEIADFDQQYFSTMAPIVVDNHVLVGTGNDLDAPGFLQSYDPETGKRQWIFYTVPMNRWRSGPRHVAESRRRASRRRPGLDSGLVRSRDEALHLRYGQSDAGLHGAGPQGRQPLHRLARRGERGHRQDGVVLPDVAARHA